MQAEALATYEVTICLILNLVRLRCAAGYECVTSVGLYKHIPHYSDVAPPPFGPKPRGILNSSVARLIRGGGGVRFKAF